MTFIITGLVLLAVYIMVGLFVVGLGESVMGPCPELSSALAFWPVVLFIVLSSLVGTFNLSLLIPPIIYNFNFRQLGNKFGDYLINKGWLKPYN